MNKSTSRIDRRSFLKLPALLPLNALSTIVGADEHHFQFEYVLGTSLDLTIWTSPLRAAEDACRTVLKEIDRLTSILSTRLPTSEISLLENSTTPRNLSRELTEVLAAYNYWSGRTRGVLSIRPEGTGAPRNVDALGKAYILDRAAEEVRKTHSSVEGLLIDIGGDIVAWGPPCRIGIADPASPYDNARPIASFELHNAAVATSGSYGRDAHLIDTRSGQRMKSAAASTVVAPDAVTANALATTLCLIPGDEGIQLVESVPGAEAVRIVGGVPRRTSGFAFLERPVFRQTPAATAWPRGYQLTVTLPLTSGRSRKRPYVSVWVEDTSGNLVRILAFWGNNSKYTPDLSTIWNLLRGDRQKLRSVTRATRPAGKYVLAWDGRDEQQRPVPLGSYRITVETNQEHGTYAKQAGTITLGNTPTAITLPATTNFDTVHIEYGPKEP
jgi:thiamine biosynthesis lipoprotein